MTPDNADDESAQHPPSVPRAVNKRYRRRSPATQQTSELLAAVSAAAHLRDSGSQVNWPQAVRAGKAAEAAARANEAPATVTVEASPLLRFAEMFLQRLDAMESKSKERFEAIERRMDQIDGRGQHTRRDVDDLIDERDHDAHVRTFRDRELRSVIDELGEIVAFDHATAEYMRKVLGQHLRNDDA